MMKKTLFGLFGVAVLALSAVPVQAQAIRGDRMVDRLATGLDLDDSQKTQVQSALEGSESVAWDVAAALQRVLTAEQKTTLFERGLAAQAYGRGLRDGSRAASSRISERGSRSESARTRRQRPRQGRSGLVNIPNLTDEQKESLNELRASQRESMQNLREEARSNDLEPDVVQERSEALSESAREQMLDILTDEQQEWFEEHSPSSGNAARGSRRGVRNSDQARRSGPGMRSGQSDNRRQEVRSRRSGTTGRGTGMASAQSRGSGMAAALDLTEDQQDLLQIHQALAAVTLAGRVRAAASRSGRPAVRRGR